MYDIAMTHLQADNPHTAENYFTKAKKRALAEKNLYLIEKINIALAGMQKQQAVHQRPLRAPKPLVRKKSQENLYPRHSHNGPQYYSYQP